MKSRILSLVSVPLPLLLLLSMGCAQRVNFLTVAFPTKTDLLLCNSNGECKMKVYARIADGEKCEVMPEYLKVEVAAGKTPKMSWKIDSIDSGHKYDYQFQYKPLATPPVYGIDIIGNTSDDFDDPGYDVVGNNSIFKWRNVHRRPRPDQPFPYVIYVERSLHGMDSWSDCTPVDPMIYND